VRRFVELAFAEVGRHIEWQGEGVDETGRCSRTGQTLVSVDPRYYRPTEVDLLLGDPGKAKQKLGWEHKTTMEELVREMVAADLAEARRAALAAIPPTVAAAITTTSGRSASTKASTSAWRTMSTLSRPAVMT
jgi:hypothetical protein